ncbi:hypothetical protein LJC27_08395 [Christensenellaceae bacterium OttesenSCG-928-M15]|nr:hypothetical protein [Christensenellaceae bacterium OttesenSCG-928-M15]
MMEKGKILTYELEFYKNLFVRTYSSLYKRVYCAVGFNKYDTEDLLQATAYHAWKSRRQLRDPEKAEAWLCRIAEAEFIELIKSIREEN